MAGAKCSAVGTAIVRTGDAIVIGMDAYTGLPQVMPGANCVSLVEARFTGQLRNGLDRCTGGAPATPGDPATGGPKIFQRQDGTSGASYEVTVENIEFLSAGEHHDEQPEGASEEVVQF
mgnify:CR=1 FL=1